VTEPFESLDEIARQFLGGEAIRVVDSQVPIVDGIAEHVVSGPQESVSHRNDGAFLSAGTDEAAILSTRIRAPLANRPPAPDDAKCPREPFVPWKASWRVSRAFVP
jgi:hypothetical protein